MKKNNTKYSLVVTWSKEDQGWGIKVPELPGCFSFVKNFNAILKASKQAIQSWIMEAKKNKIDIPKPISTHDYSGKFVTRIDPELHRTLAIQAKLKGESLNRFVQNLLHHSIHTH